MTAAVSWSSRAVIRAHPARVFDTLTDPDACARWSPIPFALEDDGDERLRTGTTHRVSGRLLGAPVRFHLHTVTAAPDGLRLHARGPIDVHVQYSLTPVASGCEIDARISIHPAHGRVGRLLARVAWSLLVAGTLDDALDRIACEAERSPVRA